MDNDYHRYIMTYGHGHFSTNESFVGKLYKSKYSRNWKKVGSIYVSDDGTSFWYNNKVSFDDIDWLLTVHLMVLNLEHVTLSLMLRQWSIMSMSNDHLDIETMVCTDMI